MMENGWRVPLSCQFVPQQIVVSLQSCIQCLQGLALPHRLAQCLPVGFVEMLARCQLAFEFADPCALPGLRQMVAVKIGNTVVGQHVQQGRVGAGLFRGDRRVGDDRIPGCIDFSKGKVVAPKLGDGRAIFGEEIAPGGLPVFFVKKTLQGLAHWIARFGDFDEQGMQPIIIPYRDAAEFRLLGEFSHLAAVEAGADGGAKISAIDLPNPLAVAVPLWFWHVSALK